MTIQNRNTAFTFVELSIVVLIIGFIIAGVAAGKSLIHQAKLNAVIIEQRDLITSINTFKLRFGMLPGDFNAAYSYWASGTCPSGSAPSGCNGNGDGQIDGYVEGWGSGHEVNRVWQHLSLAGLISGAFTGQKLASDQPVSKYTPGQYTLAYFNSTAAIYSNFLEFGIFNGYHCDQALLTTLDAYILDKKMDDGLANSGKVFGLDGYGTSPTGACSYRGGPAYTADPDVPAYNLSSANKKVCKLLINIK